MKDISIWTIFSIALLRGIELIGINFYIFYLILPGLTFSCFLIYNTIKTRQFIGYLRFIISILIISIGYHLFIFLVFRYIDLQYEKDDILKTVVIILSSLIISSIFYLLCFIIKRIAKT